MVIICILCLCLAALFIMEENREKYVPAVILKGMASLCFVIVGALAGNGSHLAKLVLIGLILGCIADILLNLRWVVKEKGKLVFLIGILVFSEPMTLSSGIGMLMILIAVILLNMPSKASV